MKKIKPVNIHFSVLVLLFFSFICFAFNTLFVKEEVKSYSLPKTQINWSELYPFENAGDKPTFENKNPLTYQEKLRKKTNKIVNLGNYFSNNKKKLPFFDFLETTGIVTSKIMSKSNFEITDSYVQTDNGMIFETDGSDRGSADIYAKYLYEFNDFLKEENIDFLFVQPAMRTNTSSKKVSPKKKITEELILELKDKNIDVLDLRNYQKKNNLSTKDLFYSTDHHWKMEYGIPFSKIIAEYLYENYGIDYDKEALDENNYFLKTYKNAMFGAYGETAGRNWSKREDFSVYYPKSNDISFDLKVPSYQIDKTGDFYEVFFDNDNFFEKAQKNDGDRCFTAIAYGIDPLFTIKNNNSKNNSKLLLIRDSFSLSLIPYLSSAFSEIHAIDIRPDNGNFNGSIRKYVKEYKPDAVLIMLSNIYPNTYK